MHTDDASLAALLERMQVDRFPTSAPENKQAWFDQLLQNHTRYHGCGHIWHQLTSPDEYQVDINLVYWVLRAYFEVYWDPALHHRVRYEVVTGTFRNKTAVVVQKTAVVHGHSSEEKEKRRNNLRGCVNKAVPLIPRHCPDGCAATNARDFRISRKFQTEEEEDVFTFHASAVRRYRERMMVPFFQMFCPEEEDGVDLLKEMERVAARHQNLTLAHLASGLPTYTITVELEEKHELF